MHRRTLLLGIFAALIAGGGAWQTLRYVRLRVELQHASELAARDAVAANRQAAELRVQLAAAARPYRVASGWSRSGDAPVAAMRSSATAALDVSSRPREDDRRSFDWAYAAFCIRVGLTPEQIDHFNALYQEHEAWRRDYFSALREQDLTAGSPGAIELKKQEDQRFEAALQDLLGADTRQKLREYDSTVSSRQVVDAVAGNLALSDDPLTLPQAKQLQQLLHSSGIDTKIEKTETWEPVLTQAATFLQPRQLGELRAQILINQRGAALRQLSDLIVQSRAAAK